MKKLAMTLALACAFAASADAVKPSPSSGGTAMIKSAVLAACRRYLRQRHIRGFLDGEYAGDIFSAQYQSFPAADRVPVAYKRSPNPGLVFICT